MFIYILFGIFFVIVLSVNLINIKGKVTFSHCINPFTIFSVFFLIIHVLLPVLQWHQQYFRYEFYYEASIYRWSASMAFIGFILVYLSYKWNNKYIKNKSIPALIGEFKKEKSTINRVNDVVISATIILCIGLFFALGNVYRIFNIGIKEYYTDRIIVGVGNGIQLLLAHWMYIACIIFFFLTRTTSIDSKRIKRISYSLFLISLSSTLAYYIFINNRNSIFILLLNIIAVYFFFNTKKLLSKVKPKMVIYFSIIIIIAISFFYQIGKLRYHLSNDLEASNYNITKNLNGAFGNHENLVWLTQNEYKLQYGKTYLSAFTNFIPRVLWNDKPLGGGPILKNTICPDSYFIGKKYNSSLTTGFLTELFLNFGYIGIVIGSLIFGIFLSVLQKVLYDSKNTMFKLIILFWIVSFTSSFLYAEFLGFIARFALTSFPLLFIYFITKKKYKFETNYTIL